RLGWWLRRVTQAGYAAAFRLTEQAGFADRGLNPFTSALIAAAQRVPADLYLAHYPAALPAAAIAARRLGARYAYDAEDFHPGDWPEDEAHEGMRRLVRAVESRHLPGCVYVTAASPGIADGYA